MNYILFNNWQNTGGIARFSEELFSEIKFKKTYTPQINPTSFLSVFYFTFLCLIHRNDIVISPGFIPPIPLFNNFIFTIHDLNHLELEDNSNYIKTLYYKYLIRPAAIKAKCVLTVSSFSRQRIESWLNNKNINVQVVYNGVSEDFSPKKNVKKEKYFFYPSNGKKHKNELLLIESFLRFNNKYSDYKLIFTGIVRNESISHPSIYYIGNVSNADLVKYYQSALATVVPSKYEGFGLPLIESIKAGTIVLFSNIEVFNEIVPSNLFKFEINNDSIFEKLCDLVENEAKYNTELEKLKLEMNKFCWKKSQNKLLSILSELQ